jgi:hypothetical protein
LPCDGSRFGISSIVEEAANDIYHARLNQDELEQPKKYPSKRVRDFFLGGPLDDRIRIFGQLSREKW